MSEWTRSRSGADEHHARSEPASSLAELEAGGRARKATKKNAQKSRAKQDKDAAELNVAEMSSNLAALSLHDEPPPINELVTELYAEMSSNLTALMDEAACDYFYVYVTDLEGEVHKFKDMTAYDTVGSLKQVIQIKLKEDVTFGLNFLGEPLDDDKASLCDLNVKGKGLVMTKS